MWGRRRILGDRGSTNVYHVYSRIINREKWLGDGERETFQRFLLAHATMAGIEVLTFAIMPNHFHALLRVPAKAEGEAGLTDEVFLDRLGAVYRAGVVARVRQALGMLRDSGDSDGAERLRRPYLDRMHDLSVFVKEVKARFSLDYNRERGRSGPLWEDRFRSVLLEGDDPALVLVVATYIDLNPLRAGLVTDPIDYRHCGYARAAAGNRERLSKISEMVGIGHGDGADALAQYRMLLFGRALPSESRQRAGIPVERVREVMDSGGHLPKLQLLRCRLRYLTDSLALGSASYLEGLFPGKVKSPKDGDFGNLSVLREPRGRTIFEGGVPDQS